MRILSNSQPTKVQYKRLRVTQAVSNMKRAKTPMPTSNVAPAFLCVACALRNSSNGHERADILAGPRKAALHNT